MVDTVEFQEGYAELFGTHCTDNHPTVKIVTQLLYPEEEIVIIDFEQLEKIYHFVRTKIQEENWCGCPRIQELKREQT